MSLSQKDIEIIKQLINAKNESTATVKDLVNTQPPTPVEKIPEIIKSMSPTELKKQFGLGIFDYKFVGIKDFMTKHNIVSNSKYPPTLNYANKHLIIEKVINSLPAKQRKSKTQHCIKVLNEKINNPPKTSYGKPISEKQLEHITTNIKNEIKRWG